MTTSRRWFMGATLALSACSSGAVPRDTFYRLGASAAPQALPGGPISRWQRRGADVIAQS